MRKSLVLAFLAFSISSTATARSVYLNGTDISSARGQELKNVTIHINEKGDIFVIAPHYQVNEEDAYVPLSKFVQGLNTPVHKRPAAVNAQGQGKVPVFENGQLKKAGDPAPIVAAKRPPPEDGDNEEKSENKED